MKSGFNKKKLQYRKLNKNYLNDIQQKNNYIFFAQFVCSQSWWKFQLKLVKPLDIKEYVDAQIYNFT